MSRTRSGLLLRACTTIVLALGLALGVIAPTTAAPTSAPTGLTASGTPIPTLSWNQMSGVTDYQVQGSESDSFATLVFDTTTPNAAYVPTRRLKSGPLYWRVRANDGQGWGPYSPTAVYTVPVVAPPANLTISGGQPTSPPVKPPVVRWDPVPGAVSYTLQVDDEGDEVGAITYDNIRGTSYVVPRPQAMGDYFVRVRANFDFGLQTQNTAWVRYYVDRLLDVTAATCDTTPITLVCAPSPTTGVRPSVSVEDVALDWDPVPGATKYEVWVAKDMSFSTTIDGPREVIGTRYSPDFTYNNGPYFWKVRAINAAGEKMPWPTTPSQFQRRWNLQPEQQWPPNDIASPVGDDFYYQWSPVRHASSYRLDVGRDANFAPGSYDTCYTAQTTYTPGHNANDPCMPAQGSVYYWRVKPLDHPTSTEGLFSDADPAEPDNQGSAFVYSSGFVSLLSPAPGASLDTNVNLPTFRWAPATDAQQYYVEVRDNTDSVAASIITSALSWTPSDKLDTSKSPYNWRVVAIDGDGKRSPRPGSGRAFTLADATPTGTPLQPLAGGTEPVGFRMPSLTWNGLTGASYYHLHMAQAGFEIAPGTVDVLGRNLYYPSVTDYQTQLVKPGTYTWWVTAHNDQGVQIGNPGPTATFTITRPGAVGGQKIALDGRALDTGATCTSALANNGAFCDGVPSTPVLDWAPVAGAGGYLVYLAWDRDVSTRVLDPYAVTTNSRWTPKNDILNALKDNESQESYYWFIRPCVSVSPVVNCGPDPANQANSATHAFRKVSPPVKQLLPAVDSVERGSEVTFTWEDYRDTNANAYFPLGQTEHASHQSAKYYRLQVAQSPTVTDANAIQDVTVDQATFTSYTRTYPEGDLWWRVQAIDEQDNRLAWSQPRKFVKSTPTNNLDPATVVSNERPYDASATFPTFNSHQPAGSTTFQWNAYDFDGYWQLEVYRNNDTTGAEGSLVLRREVYQAAYAVDEPIPASSEPYRWRVRRMDVNGQAAAWSDWGKFYVDPAQPVLSSPVDGAVQSPNGMLLQWQPLAGARSYRVSLQTPNGDEVVGDTTPATAWAVPRTITSGTYRWQVTARDLSDRTIGTSQRTVVVDGAVIPLAGPQIQAPNGTGVGATLTSTPPTWSQSDVATTYQWLRDGGNIDRADQPTYTLTIDDFGKDITLKVTGRRPSYAEGSAVSNAIRVTAGGALVATVQPAITGTAKPGETLSVSNGSWSQSTDFFTYQWMRNGAPIPKATGSGYQLVAEDAGKDVSAVVLASRRGFADGSATAPAVSVAKMTSTTAFTMSTTNTSRKKKVAFGITVTVPGLATPSGTVRIMDGVKTLKTLTLDPFRKGVLKAKLKVAKKGRHKIKVVYTGNAVTDGSKSKVQRLIVTK